MMINLLTKLDPYFIQIGSFTIYWYAIFIIIGAILALAISKYFAKKAGYSSDMIDNLFFISFPAGLIGARIWFVLSNLSAYTGSNWYHAFFSWEGGLAIQGGVVFGALAGIIYIKKAHKEIEIKHVLDLVVPNILIAQAIGRWGNFFNQEVYGQCVDASKLSFLPKFILNQMQGGGDIACAITEVAQPLFLYESILNILGFVLISILLRKFWKSRKNGSLAMSYFVWYGVVRVLLEPLRNEMYIMQIMGVRTSIITSIAFIVFGVLGIIYLNFFKNKKEVK